MKKREAIFIAALATLGGDGCRNGDGKPPESARVSAIGTKEPQEKNTGGELEEEKKEAGRKPRKFVDVLGMDLGWRKEGRGITKGFDFEGETKKLLDEAREKMWQERFGSSQNGLERYFHKIIEDLEYRHKVWQAVNKYCRHYRVPPEVAAGIIGVESGGDNAALSSANARGIFQVKDVVLEELQRINFNEEKDWGTVSSTSVDGNCRVGIAYLRYLYDRYSQWSFALAAYRGGPAAVDASIRGSSKYSREEEDNAGSFRKAVFKNAITATAVASEKGLGLSDNPIWQYPFGATVMARPVYEILTSEEKKPEIAFGK